MKGFKYIKRDYSYKASNNEYNAVLKQATSYDWWVYFKEIDGLNVFNAYPYSPSTRQHQNKMKRLLEYLNIPIDVEVNIPDSLTALSNARHIEVALVYEMNTINDAIAKLVRKSSKKRDWLESEKARVLRLLAVVSERKAS